MSEDSITKALSELGNIDNRLGPYCGHEATTRGVTLQTPTRVFFLTIHFISQLLYQPESLTKEVVDQELLRFG